MNRPQILVALLLLVCAAALVVGVVELALTDRQAAEPTAELPGLMQDLWAERGGRPKKDGIGVVEVSGIIQFGSDQSSPWASFEQTADKVAQRIRELRREQRCKAIVLRVNSPGGSLAASQEIFEEVRLTAREAKKPVVVSMGDMAASGGYYISAPATRIVAQPGTITGSIGVIVSGLNLKGLLERHGVKVDAITSGKNKDTLAYYRDLRPDELELLGKLVDEAYGQFLAAVSEHRGIPLDDLKPNADGRVLLGSQAKRLGLVDQLGSFHDAVKLAAELAGIQDEEPYLIRRGESLWERLDLNLGGLVTGGRGVERAARALALSDAARHGSLRQLPVSYLYLPPLTPLAAAEAMP
ncbi:MAG: signal peptide peptidase SppA [Deltaproteobacteria bacterium]|nr:signal peptide peptidase SppA [Deltaproteobacteria bacterium]